MSLGYDHTATVTRPDTYSGATNAFGQPTTDPGDVTVYDGEGDFQYGMSDYRRSEFGDANLDANGIWFFPETVDITQFQRGDNISITGVASSAIEGTVKGFDYLNTALAIKITD